MRSVADREHTSIQTRSSLIDRLKHGEDESWQFFYRVYGEMVRGCAKSAGLTDTEADEALQETAIAVARHLPQFRYNPEVCRFKTWLLNQTRWRIQDQFKKRRRGSLLQKSAAGSRVEAPARADTIDRLLDPSAVDLDAVFQIEWRKNLMALALERIKTKFSPRQFQIFDLKVLQNWPAKQIARSLGVTVANVYVTKHRVSAALKKEVKHLGGIHLHPAATTF